MTRRSDSGSSRSPSDVEPVTSVNTTVTVLRTSRTSAGMAVSSDPHARQNFAMSGLSWPHCGQAGMWQAYGDPLARRQTGLHAGQATERGDVLQDVAPAVAGEDPPALEVGEDPRHVLAAPSRQAGQVGVRDDRGKGRAVGREAVQVRADQAEEALGHPALQVQE